MPYEISNTMDTLKKEFFLSEAKLKELEDTLKNVDPQLILDVTKQELYEWRKPEIEGGVAVIDLQGPLSTKDSFFSWLFGGTTYENLLQQMNYISSVEEVNTILLNVNGPGGQAYRCIETARNIRAIADKSDKKIIAYVDGVAASATAGITCAAHEIIMNPESEFGSIGAVAQLTSNTKAKRKAGIEIKYITAGKSKVSEDDKGNFKPEFLSEMQEKVDTLYENFTSYVADARNISQEVVKDTEAKMLSADKAQALGLVDKIMEVEDFYEYLASQSEDDTTTTTTTDSKKINVFKPAALTSEQKPKMTGELMSKVEKTEEEQLAIDEKIAKLEATAKDQAELLASYMAKEETQQREELSSRFSESYLASSKDNLIEFFMSSDIKEDSKTLLSAVIESAATASKELTASYEAKLVEAASKVSQAEADMEKVKTEFATVQHSEEGETVETLSGQAAIDAKAAKLKAAQNK